MNIFDTFRRVLFTNLNFCDFPMDKCNATAKTNGGSFKKYSKLTPTIHTNPNSYSFRIMFIMIIVRFFIICFINGWKYEKVARNGDRVTNWCVYLLKNDGINEAHSTFDASGAPETRNVNGEPATCSPAYFMVSACLPDSWGLTFNVKVASPWS